MGATRRHRPDQRKCRERSDSPTHAETSKGKLRTKSASIRAWRHVGAETTSSATAPETKLTTRVQRVKSFQKSRGTSGAPPRHLKPALGGRLAHHSPRTRRSRVCPQKEKRPPGEGGLRPTTLKSARCKRLKPRAVVCPIYQPRIFSRRTSSRQRLLARI